MKILTYVGIGLLIAVVLIALGMVFAALVVGVAGVLFFDAGFVDSWHMAWERPGWLFVFMLLVASSGGVSASRRS